jgi:hypothetical protein
VCPKGSTATNSLQAWAKPIGGEIDAVAVLLINPDTQAHEFSVPLSALPLTGSGVNVTLQALTMRDIWARADRPALSATATTLVISVDGMDSAFVRLEIKKE